MQESGWKAPPQWNTALEAHFCVGVQKCAGKEHKAPENQFVAALFPPGCRRRGGGGADAEADVPFLRSQPLCRQQNQYSVLLSISI